MASNIQQWESDPLFAAAEVVQDSADRMESIFRLLLHEQSLAQGPHPELRLLHSIEYHKRDLATSLETAKWQLEDFEREVNLLAVADMSEVRQKTNSRHKQFVGAIKEQITNVEKSFQRTAAADSVGNTAWVNLNEQDRDVLASFLSGGKPVKHVGSLDSVDDRSASKNFLDPASSSSISCEIVEKKTENVNMNGVANLDPNILSENKLSDLQVATSGRVEENDWDLEANEPKVKTWQKPNKIVGFCSRMRDFRSLRDFIFAYGGRGNRSLTKRLKDGEEHRHSPRWFDNSHAMQGLAWGSRNFQFLVPQLYRGIISSSRCLRDWTEGQWRSPNSIRVRYRSVVLISTIFFTLIVLGILVRQNF